MTEYPYFPLFVNLSGKKILIVGAGSIALRRAEALSPFGAAAGFRKRIWRGRFWFWLLRMTKS